MNGLIVLAAVVCTGSAQLYASGLPVNSAPSHQFHAQDEFGQFSFGHAGGPSARTEARNAYGVTTGSYQYIDANGLIQTVNYIADQGGFRVQGTNLPVAIGAQAPAPIFEGVQIGETQDVIDAKAAFAVAYAAQVAAVAAVAPAAPVERKRREVVAEAAPIAAPIAAGLPLGYAGLPIAGAYGGYAGLPIAGVNGAYAGLPIAGVNGAYAGLPFAGVNGAYAGLPFAGVNGGYAGLPYAGIGSLAYAGALPLAGGLPYAAANGLISPLAFGAPGAIVSDIAHATPEIVAPAALGYAGLAPLALTAAAPSREATLTTVKLNPGHAVSYRVD